MQIKYKVNFALEKRKDKKTGKLIESNVPINMVVTYSGKRLIYYTGYRIDFDKWINKKIDGVKINCVKNNVINEDGISAAVVNSRLIELKSKVDRLFFSYGTVIPATQKLRTDLKNDTSDRKKQTDVLTLFDRYINEVEVSEGRRKHLRTTWNLLSKYLKDKRPGIKSIDTEFISEFHKSLRTYKAIKDGKPIVRNRAKNTIIVKLKMFRAFLSHAEKERLITRNPFKDYQVESERYGDPIFLTKEERDSLYYLDIDNPRLARARDLFLLQCFIGCRVGDFIKLKHSNIINGIVHYIPEKTSSEAQKVCKVPLTSKARAIIEKYDMPDGSLVPFMSPQKYNDYIKELLEYAGINRPVVRLNPVTRKEEIVPIYQVASSHMARRTFIGLLHKTVKNEIISSMSGHSENSKAFKRYYNVDEEDQKTAINTIE